MARTAPALARRVGDRPLIVPADINPSQPGFEVQVVLNPAAALIDDRVALLLRVGERPRGDIDPPADALTLDLSGDAPSLVPLTSGYRKSEVVPIAFEDPSTDAFRYLPVYLPKDLPGLDTSDPRGVTFTHPRVHRTMTFLTQISHLRCAWSDDGETFEISDEQLIRPTNELEEYGCEDARATLIDGLWHITYTAVSRFGVTPCLAVTSDFKQFEKRGAIVGPDNKDVAFFPYRDGGQYVALTRPMPSVFGHVLGMWLVWPDSRLPWGARKPLVMPRPGFWDERQTGAGVPPFRCERGWLEIYHGVSAEREYALGAVLLDGNDPSRVLARSGEPILRAETAYEREGLMSNVVYACGYVPRSVDRIRVYYGAGDAAVAAADFDVDEILDSLLPV